MKINEAQFDMSNYDIAMDFYQSIMHSISNNKDTHVDIHEIMLHVKHTVDTDKSPLAVELRKQSQQMLEMVTKIGTPIAWLGEDT